MRVSEIRVNQIRVNQGLGVFHLTHNMAMIQPSFINSKWNMRE